MDFTLPADLREMQTHIRNFALNDVEARAHEIEADQPGAARTDPAGRRAGPLWAVHS